MVTSTTEDTTRKNTIRKRSDALLLNGLTAVTAVFLFGIGVWMRLHDLGLSFDRDSYDEGVYWQSLRAMGSGYHLYQQVFYSQPPFFLLSIFPTYMLFGQTLWSARLGIALVSLLGLGGAFLLGYALSGRIGAIVALLLLVINPLYLQQSQTIQAEAPFVAFSLLAAGATYLWWKHPSGGRWSMVYAALAGIALSLSIFCKLFGVATLAPIGLLFLAQLWRISRQERHVRPGAARSLIVGVASFILVSLALLVPFVGSFHQLVSGVISFHTAAGTVYQYTTTGNPQQIQHVLTSLLALVALYGTIVALLRRDWRVLPLLAWFAATAILLLQQAPLFPHHEVAFVAPLIALAVLGVGPLVITRQPRQLLYTGVTLVTLCLVVWLSIVNLNAIQHYYRNERRISNSITITKWDVNVAHDVESMTAPNQLVISDAQFIVGLAHRNVDPLLVDTSTVRVTTGYLTAQQLLTEAQQPSVHAVLFYTGRLLHMKNIALFYSWLKQHFHLVHNYSPGKELWIRVS